MLDFIPRRLSSVNNFYPVLPDTIKHTVLSGYPLFELDIDSQGLFFILLLSEKGFKIII